MLLAIQHSTLGVIERADIVFTSKYGDYPATFLYSTEDQLTHCNLNQSALLQATRYPIKLFNMGVKLSSRNMFVFSMSGPRE